MLRDRGIRRGIEVFVKDLIDPGIPERKARVVNTYPHPSRWLVVQYKDGNMVQVEESQVTTMFEKKKGIEIWRYWIKLTVISKILKKWFRIFTNFLVRQQPPFQNL